MVLKKVVLLAVSLLLIVVFFEQEFNKVWLNQKILQIGNPDDEVNIWNCFAISSQLSEQIGKQSEHMSMRERKENRYGLSYVTCEAVDSILKINNVKDAYILFPPNAYIKEGLHFDFGVPEPLIFYYFTGRQGLWTNSPNVQKTNWAYLVLPANNTDLIRSLVPNGQKFYPLVNDRGILVALLQVNDQKQLDILLNLYKNYKAEL
jgi:hypothetical protein